MKKIILFVGVALMNVSAYSVNFCQGPLREEAICLKMKNLRSQVNFLEEQRDLMQVNYPMLKAVSEDMMALTNDLLDNHNTSGRLDLLTVVNSKAKVIMEYAEAKDPKAVVQANQVHKQCLRCHSQSQPESGYSWDVIAKKTWGDIVLNCNNEKLDANGNVVPKFGNTVIELERNPYRCKSMHGMFTAMEYLVNSASAGRNNYEMTEQAAAEIKRISLDLLQKKMYPENKAAALAKVNQQASELESLAKDKNILALLKRVEIAQTCMKCHDTVSMHRLETDKNVSKVFFKSVN